MLSGLEQQSKDVFMQLEEEHQKLQPLLDTIQQRFKDCKKSLAEIEQFSQHTLN